MWQKFKAWWAYHWWQQGEYHAARAAYEDGDFLAFPRDKAYYDEFVRGKDGSEPKV